MLPGMSNPCNSSQADSVLPVSFSEPCSICKCVSLSYSTLLKYKSSTAPGRFISRLRADFRYQPGSGNCSRLEWVCEAVHRSEGQDTQQNALLLKVEEYGIEQYIATNMKPCETVIHWIADNLYLACMHGGVDICMQVFALRCIYTCTLYQYPSTCSIAW